MVRGQDERLTRDDIAWLHDMVTLNENLCAAMGSIVANTTGVVHRWRDPRKACARVYDISTEALRGKFDEAILHRAKIMRLTAARDARAKRAGTHGRVAPEDGKYLVRRARVPEGARELACALEKVAG